MGTAQLSTYFEETDKEAILRKLEQMHDGDLHEYGYRYDQGGWGGVYADKSIFVNNEPIRYDDINDDEQMSRVKDKGDCRAVRVLAPKDYSGSLSIPLSGISLTYETTVTAEEVELLSRPGHEFASTLRITPLLKELRDCIIDAVEGEEVEIVREKYNAFREVESSTTETVVYSRDDWNTHAVYADLSGTRAVKSTKGKRTTQYEVVTEHGKAGFQGYVEYKKYGTFATEKKAKEFIAENLDKKGMFDGAPYVQGVVTREDGSPLAEVQPSDSVISVKIILSERKPDSELVEGYMIYAKSAC